MTHRVSLRVAARADLQEAYDWYDERCPGLGDEFLAAIAETLLRLETNPEEFPVYYRGFRRVLTRRFPYKLFFRTEGNSVIVFRILHGAQDYRRRL
jgi:toxin ParE1/3/4